MLVAVVVAVVDVMVLEQGSSSSSAAAARDSGETPAALVSEALRGKPGKPEEKGVSGKGDAGLLARGLASGELLAFHSFPVSFTSRTPRLFDLAGGWPGASDLARPCQETRCHLMDAAAAAAAQIFTTLPLLRDTTKSPRQRLRDVVFYSRLIVSRWWVGSPPLPRSCTSILFPLSSPNLTQARMTADPLLRIEWSGSFVSLTLS